MTITNGYATLADLKRILDINDADDDADLEVLIETVSRWVDDYTGRRFYTGEDEARYFTADNWKALEIDDLVSITSLKTDEDLDGTYEVTWDDGADYMLYPFNAVAKNEPYNAIIVAPNGDNSFPSGVKAVEITGKFGYCELANVPKPITRATLIQAARLYKREDAPFGVAGPNQFGQNVIISALDPDVKELLDHYCQLA